MNLKLHHHRSLKIIESTEKEKKAKEKTKSIRNKSPSKVNELCFVVFACISFSRPIRHTKT